jgi:chorismate lyase
LSPAALPVSLRPWLLDTGSLTERLMRACNGKFRVHVVNQRYAVPLRNEAQALSLSPRIFALVREVQLMCADTPWVWARTVIPRTTLTGRERRLARLRSRSLGATLFADPSTVRGEIEVALLRPGDRLYAPAARACRTPPTELWARRARFLLNNKPLLVQEIFLPDLGEFPA